MSILPEPLLNGFIFVLGLFVGSFLNVCIWRLPAGEQVVKGRSHCRGCQRVIPWYDNVPLISFLLLKGRCRFCQAKISWVYPAVELATGLLFLAIAMRFGIAWKTLIYLVFAASLIVIACIDARHKIIPREVALPGAVLALMASFFVPSLHSATSPLISFLQSIGGALLGASFIAFMRVFGGLLFQREAMGEGDIDLMAMIGAVIGPWKVLLVNLFFAPLLGALYSLPFILRYGYKKVRFMEIPYGPFLALGALIALFFGEAIINHYRLILTTL